MIKRIVAQLSLGTVVTLLSIGCHGGGGNSTVATSLGALRGYGNAKIVFQIDQRVRRMTWKIDAPTPGTISVEVLRIVADGGVADSLARIYSNTADSSHGEIKVDLLPGRYNVDVHFSNQWTIRFLK